MRSFTFNSETAEVTGTAPWALVCIIFRNSWLIFVISGLFIAAGEIWSRIEEPDMSNTSIERIIVSEQLERAGTITDADIIMTGDSSALMGLDVVMLGELIGGRRVESLATIGYVGPDAYGRILEIFTSHAGYTPVVIILMHGESLNLSEEKLNLIPLEEKDVKRLPFGHEARRKLFEDVIGRVVSIPLPGAYGRHYGWPEDFRKALRSQGGTLTDPNKLDANSSKRDYEFTLTGPVEERMARLGEILERLNPCHVYFGITPLHESSKSGITLTSRAAVLRRCAYLLRLNDRNILGLPVSMPDRYFSTFTHLNYEGQKVYTSRVARTLIELSREGEGEVKRCLSENR
ncbi:MAG: hypothetical protein AB1742_03820 [bacterium]